MCTSFCVDICFISVHGVDRLKVVFLLPMLLDNPFPLNVGGICDLLLTNKIQQRWCMWLCVYNYVIQDCKLILLERLYPPCCFEKVRGNVMKDHVSMSWRHHLTTAKSCGLHSGNAQELNTVKPWFANIIRSITLVTQSTCIKANFPIKNNGNIDDSFHNWKIFI